MKGFFKNLNPRETSVIIILLLIFTAGIIIKYSGWNKPERFDYSETDRQFGEKTKADFNRLKEQKLNELQSLRSDEIKKLADSLLIDNNKDNNNDKALIIGKSININSAYAVDLMKLPGVGEITADRIIEYREKTGRFKRIDELMNVKGIGKKKFEKIMPYVTIE